ncbi:uncharacterized protein N7506_005681 [Penicillium brevicompactum]|uniref:uncharacterized protein n=1 Tax=Penicillium brevicompactum TaxID=5074 RepID=UPI002540D7AC|nr:uncharacterized protein N7506_005681 [Penicillium brevicompactum]KAJ5335745.1 hypothetical protein N7506_005681 [Penicillium brevicompactum]
MNQNKPLPALPLLEYCGGKDLPQGLNKRQESLHREIIAWFPPQIPKTEFNCLDEDKNNSQSAPAQREKWVSLPLNFEKRKQWRKQQIYSRPESALGISTTQSLKISTTQSLKDSPDVGSLLELVELHPELQREFELNGLPLIQRALKRSVPEQWEFREMSINCGIPGTIAYYESLGRAPDECTHQGWGVDSYLRHYAEEMAVCAQLTGLMRERCAGRTHTERDVLEAMRRLSGPRWASVHRAFWRVWTFCRIFGCAKEREEDARGQRRWLCGFVSAKGKDLVAATFTPTDDNSELLCLPPDPFGYGNGSGLSITEIQDMAAVWTFLEDLLRAHLGSPL